MLKKFRTLLGSLYQKKDYHSYSYYKTNLELLGINESLEVRFNILSMEYSIAKRELADKDQKIKDYEDEIRLLKSQLLHNENKVNELATENDSMRLKILTKADGLENQRLTIEVLEKQIYAINEALNNTQTSLENILSQKSRLVSSRFQEFIEDNVEYKEIKLPDYFKHSYNFNFDPFYNRIPQSLILNPNYNENKDQQNTGIQMRNITDDPPFHTFESNADRRLASEEDKFDENGDQDGGSQYENVSRGNRDSRLLDDQRKTPQKESFISNLDLQNAFSNASDVIILFIVSF